MFDSMASTPDHAATVFWGGGENGLVEPREKNQVGCLVAWWLMVLVAVATS